MRFIKPSLLFLLIIGVLLAEGVSDDAKNEAKTIYGAQFGGDPNDEHALHAGAFLERHGGYANPDAQAQLQDIYQTNPVFWQQYISEGAVCGDGQCEAGENNQNCPSDCSLPTCAEQEGSICQAGEVCPGQHLEASDTEKCCSEACTQPMWEFCGECGTGLFNLCDRVECYSITETCLFSMQTTPDSCEPCADYTDCNAYTDQQSCSDNHCGFEPCNWNGASCEKQPSCFDGEQNGQESDVDCGGNCNKCENGFDCNSGADCESNYCSAGKCQNGGSITITLPSVANKDGRAKTNEASTVNSFTNLGNVDTGVTRGFLYFDTSSVPSAATIISATLKIHGYNFAKSACPAVGNVDLYKCNFDPLDVSDFSGCSPGTKNGKFINLPEIGGAQLVSVAVDAGMISKAGMTQLKLKSQDEACTNGVMGNYARYCSDSCNNPSDRPTLIVTYTG